MFGSRKIEQAQPVRSDYNVASLEDRFAERAMVHLMGTRRLQADSLDMEFAKVAKGAYRMAKFMMAARVAK